MIIMKPHHFMDIIKLYGAGIETFVPDEAYKHDFYLKANEILNEHQIMIQTTIDEDDICSPCIHIGDDGLCKDGINHIEGITSKDKWNKIIDHRIIKYSGISFAKVYTAQEYCHILYSIREHISDIWLEETSEAKDSRYNNFCKGAKKYLDL